MKFPVEQLPEDTGPPERSVDALTGSNDVGPGVSMLGVDLVPNQTPTTPPAGAAMPAVQTAVGTGGWTEELGAHVIWMAHQGVSNASLRLQPEHLGPLEVKISLHEATASVWFGANEPDTRAALRAALPQLKEMFAAQGMNLTDAGVSREPPRNAPHAPQTSTQTSAASTAAETKGSTTALSSRRGLLDTYA